MTNSEELRQKADKLREAAKDSGLNLYTVVVQTLLDRAALYECAAGVCAAIEQASAK